LITDLLYGWCEFDLGDRAMHTTKIFKNGNSQAVRIPSDLAYERTDIELEIERQGEEIRIRPAKKMLEKVLNKFARFSPEFFAEVRGEHEQAERDAL
jgi:antitoxin VapB